MITCCFLSVIVVLDLSELFLLLQSYSVSQNRSLLEVNGSDEARCSLSIEITQQHEGGKIAQALLSIDRMVDIRYRTIEALSAIVGDLRKSRLKRCKFVRAHKDGQPFDHDNTYGHDTQQY